MQLRPSGAVDADYTISYVSATLSVTPASLAITADNKTKVYGAALPTLTASYTGFVNGDTSASLTTLPTLVHHCHCCQPRLGQSLCDYRQRRGGCGLHHQLCERCASLSRRRR